MVAYSAFIGLIAFKILVLAVSGVPKTAEASLFSAVTSIFASSTDVPEASDINSQKMPLLEAPVNVDVNVNKVSIAKASTDTALSTESAPIGSQAGQNISGDTISIYKVKSGDTISGIAEHFGISVNTVLWANNLSKTSKITIGQSLIILPVSGAQHTVVSGDTLSTIAAKYKADIDEILAYNNLEKTDTIQKGDKLLIPNAEVGPQPTASLASITKKVTAGVLTAGVAKASADAKGYYARPIKGGVRTQGIHGTNAVDLADSCGVPVYASAAGTVTISKSDGSWNGGFGNYVVLNHDNGSQTLYAHLTKATVSEDATVKKDEQIGTIGSTGKVHGVTGCHVHFEIRNGPRNPF